MNEPGSVRPFQLESALGRALGPLVGRILGRVKSHRRVNLGKLGYVTITGRGASLSARPCRGITLLLRPRERPRLTLSAPGTGLAMRRSLPLPKLWFLSPSGLRRRGALQGYRFTVEQTLDRFYPGIEAPRVVLCPRARTTVARFVPRPEERIIVSSRLAARLPEPIVTQALVRESVRAGLWAREGRVEARRFREELARAGDGL